MLAFIPTFLKFQCEICGKKMKCCQVGFFSCNSSPICRSQPVNLELCSQVRHFSFAISLVQTASPFFPEVLHRKHLPVCFVSLVIRTHKPGIMQSSCTLISLYSCFRILAGSRSQIKPAHVGIHTPVCQHITHRMFNVLLFMRETDCVVLQHARREILSSYRYSPLLASQGNTNKR